MYGLNGTATKYTETYTKADQLNTVCSTYLGRSENRLGPRMGRMGLRKKIQTPKNRMNDPVTCLSAYLQKRLYYMLSYACYVCKSSPPSQPFSVARPFLLRRARYKTSVSPISAYRANGYGSWLEASKLVQLMGLVAQTLAKHLRN